MVPIDLIGTAIAQVGGHFCPGIYGAFYILCTTIVMSECYYNTLGHTIADEGYGPLQFWG